MNNILTSTYLLLITVCLLQILDANRRGWNGGGGNGNRGGSRWKTGSGGFNSWRQQNFKHSGNNNHHTIINSNDGRFDSYNRPSWNNFNNQEYISSKPDPEVPTVNFSHVPEHTSCAIPTMGDTSKFELRCIFPNSEQDEDCTEAGSYLASGTSAMLRCKPPYVSESGDLRIWVCEEGIWKGEFKSFSCSHSPISSNTGNNWNGGGNRYTSSNHEQNNDKFYNRPNTHWSSQKTPESPVQTNSWKQPESIIENTGIPSLISDLLGQVIGVEDSKPMEQVEPGEESVQPPWQNVLDKWKPKPVPTTPPPTTTTTATTPRTTTTTESTTTTTTTIRSYIPPPSQPDPPAVDWDYLQQKKNGTGVKCPSLSKRTGIKLECLSKSSVPWDPSSFLVTQSDCSSTQNIGTEATYKCEPYYEANVGLTLQYRKCKDDGTWTGEENRFSCAMECGKSNPVGKIPLITNGEPTYKAQWPWHAALFFQDMRRGQTQYEYNCGATLINQRAVLTASHCVTEVYSKSVKSATQFRIDLGRYERTVQDEFVQTFSAEEIIPHPSYNPISFDSDIAIIILKGSASVGFHVRPICYPQSQNSAFEELHLSDGSYGTVVGFGKDETGELSDTLHMAKLKVVSQQECSESFADTRGGAGFTKSTTFCAGLKNGTNVCSGDSGGGIYFPVSSGGVSRWYLQGLVSVGISDENKKCDPTRYSVFTKISPYADWIVRVLSERDAL